jgi:hypothetical protein
MTEITDARDAYLAARQRVEDTRLALGRAIREARAQGTEQVDIAEKLNLTREQVRRYQDEYETKAGLKKPKPGRES